LLRSPKASEGQGGALGEAEALRRGNTVGVRDQVMDLVASQGYKVSRQEVNDLLPTTAARDYKDGNKSYMREGVVQVDTVARAIFNSGEVNLLPTPNTMEHREIKTPEQIAELKLRSPGGYRNLREEVINEATSWGKFEPAIKRWEQILGRQAPSPTKPDGKNGNHRLSSKFTEFLMGLPDGWITNVGLSRNEELKACGNGVVPQQAFKALVDLMKIIDKGEENESK
jgi:hypothetical protein